MAKQRTGKMNVVHCILDKRCLQHVSLRMGTFEPLTIKPSGIIFSHAEEDAQLLFTYIQGGTLCTAWNRELVLHALFFEYCELFFSGR